MKELGSVLRKSVKSECVQVETKATDQLSIVVAVSVVLPEQPGENRRKDRKAVRRSLSTKDPHPHDFTDSRRV